MNTLIIRENRFNMDAITNSRTASIDYEFLKLEYRMVKWEKLLLLVILMLS